MFDKKLDKKYHNNEERMKYCVVFGCCTLDIATYEKDGTKEISFGGKGGNQAVALSRAGVKTYMLTKLSKLKSEIKHTKAHIKNLKRNKVITKFIEFDFKTRNDYTNVIISKNGDNELLEKVDISQNVDVEYVRKNKKLLQNASYVLIQMKVPVEVTREIIQICNAAGVKIVLTPCRIKKMLDNLDLIEKVDYITCNQKEASLIFGKDGKLSASELNSVLKRYPNKLIVTLGGKGVKFFDGKKIIYEKAIQNLNVIDTTGAGDTFCSNFVSSLFEGDTYLVAVRKAICSSSIKIQSKGTQNGMPYKKARDKFYLETFATKQGEL